MLRKIALIIFIIFLGEALLRLSNIWIGRHSDTMFKIIEYDAGLGWKMRPNINETIDLVDVEDIPVRSNSQGFRDSEFTAERTADRYRIAFLGDSFTWGFSVRAEERFSSLVAQRHADWECLNFGMPAYGSDQTLLVWRNIARYYRPDAVILTVYQNDYFDNICMVRSGRSKPYFELQKSGKLELKNVPVEPETFWDNGVYNQVAPPYAAFFAEPVQKRSRIKHWLVKSSELVRSLYTLLRSKKTESSEAQRHLRQVADLSEIARLEVKLLDAMVGELAQDVEKLGGKFLLVFAGDSLPQYELQKSLFNEKGINFIDATSAVLEKMLSQTNAPVYYRYSGHWTKAAHRAISELLLKELFTNYVYSRNKRVSS